MQGKIYLAAAKFQRVQKKQRQTQRAKYQVLSHQAKVNSISKNYKKIPYYNDKLNASTRRMLNQR